MGPNPTKTKTLRRRWIKDLESRFKQVRTAIKTAVDDLDVFGLETPRVNISAGEFAFNADPAKVALFMSWLEEQVNENILETYQGMPSYSTSSHWQDIYVERAYQKGMKQASGDLVKAGFLEAAIDVPNLAGTPYHVDAMGTLFIRDFTELKNITSAMSTGISRSLTSGLSQGLHPTQLAQKLVQDVDKIGIIRARMLARTETIRAFHKAKVNMFRQAGVYGVKVLAEILTGGNPCPTCQKLSLEIYTLDEIEEIIPVHPNCECTIIPANVGE